MGKFFGAVVSVLLICGTIALGVWIFTGHKILQPKPQAVPQAAAAPTLDMKEVVETKTSIPILAAPIPYVPTTITVDGKTGPLVTIELSEYAGYSGIMVANGGMEPSVNSYFYKNYGFFVKLTLSEEESWGKLNAGKMAASATTADVLSAYGKQFNVTVPAQISYSRGADGIDVVTGINRINDLKGKVLATCQFTESDYMIRYLCNQAGLSVNMLTDLNATPDADKVNLIYCDDGFKSGDLFARDVAQGTNKLAGCVTWSPKTEDVVANSGGKVKTLITNRNLLIVADIFIVNKGFADANPKMVEGMTDAIYYGNKLVRDDPAPYAALIEKCFKWEKGDALKNLKSVHLTNVPEGIAFFAGDIDAAGSYDGIYNSATLAYGDLIQSQTPSSHFLNMAYLTALAKLPDYKDQKIEIKPIKLASSGDVENNPILSKSIRFTFAPNSTTLEDSAENDKNFDSIKQLLQVSPGSTILLRGHVDDAKVAEFKEKGDDFYQAMRQKAMAFSDKRAKAVQKAMIDKLKIDPARVEAVGRGWEEPAVPTNPSMNDSDREAASIKNRRVEVQWFTLE